MSGTLHTLLRLRTLAREETSVAVRKAEDEREAQLARLVAVRESVAQARTETDLEDALDLSAYYAFRLRSEMAERREAARLAQKERDVEQKRALHVVRVRDEIAMQNVIDHREREASADESRRDAARMDEIAARRSERA